MTRILAIDDEESITQFLKMGLEAEGYEVITASEGMTGIQLAEKWKPAVAIVDIMMPGMDGYEVCRSLKKYTNCQVILLSAKGEVTDRVTGLNAGADDYMVKPFSFEELIARVQARLRNTPQYEEQPTGLFSIDDEQKQITYQGEALTLTRTEYKLLRYFIQHKNKVLSKEAILNAVWGYDYYGNDNVVEAYIKTLRQKLQDPEHQVIQTLRGFGYKLDVTE
ncbi:response regulator transcription factor [Kurthia gibsonii]|uniref:Response regulator transcription factor n=1 Tax=Kurthia gibsonii TaxID=33946 RepID=A0ABU9LKS8_9BACL|nr:response regulator transcription factor [Kurthia gibsonii]MEB7772955.1 response regulator transcription factor [Kurthia gibsonii]RXH51578.1 response regulator transcription factor [Kurthia gibsonii]